MELKIDLSCLGGLPRISGDRACNRLLRCTEGLFSPRYPRSHSRRLLRFLRSPASTDGPAAGSSDDKSDGCNLRT